MGEIIDWIQSYWFELGSLLIQSAVLVTLALYGRKVLRILSVSNEQNEAPRRVSVPNVAAEQRMTQERVAPAGFEPAEHRSDEGTAARSSFIAWLQAPMKSGGSGPRGRVIKWLQAPMGS
jgi:hypothetical protein